jgi:hypothetical protein
MRLQDGLGSWLVARALVLDFGAEVVPVVQVQGEYRCRRACGVVEVRDVLVLQAFLSG